MINKEYTKVVALLCLYNCVVMSLFTILAITFNSCWLIFASILFCKNVKVQIESNKKGDLNGSEF